MIFLEAHLHLNSIVFTEPILILEVSPSSVIISPNDQFTVTCTARAEVDGQGLPVIILIAWSHAKSPSGLNESFLNPTEYSITKTGSPESGYKSILTTTENDTVNMIIYQCKAKMATYSSEIRVMDVTVVVKGMQFND